MTNNNMSDKKEYPRKLAAIMFTDMVGYSKLSQINEDLALELLEEHRVILRNIFPKHDGTEIETVGDAFFVEFESALEAVRCAVEIQETLHQRNQKVPKTNHINLRIGVHLGDVVHREKNVLGDGVNIAARIEPLAEPEGICISQDVARQVQNKIEWKLKKLDPQNLKNIQLPMEVYSIELSWNKKVFPSKLDFFPDQKTSRNPFLIPGMITAAIILIIIVLYIVFPSDTGMGKSNSIGVLPFKNISGEMENEYFSDGITEDIIAQLSKISNLRVISRTSMMQYKNSEKSLKQIGEDLKVANILEGSVRCAGNRIRIVAQLIDAKTDNHLWTNTYNKEMTEIFAIQSNVAENIAKELKATISPEEKKRLSIKSTENLEAYDLYLKGRYYWNKMMPDDLEKSLDYFNQAIDLDPNYALAYSGLADGFIIQGNFSIVHPSETYPKAKTAAIKAVTLDENLAGAHNSLAFTMFFSDWDWIGAEREFRRAITLNPGDALAHSWYALFLTAMGRFGEANEASTKAMELDPLSPVILANRGLELYMGKKYDLSIEQNRKTLEINPLFHAAYITLGGAYVQKKMYTDAIVTFSKASLFSKGHPIPVAALGYAYAVSGKHEDAMMMLELLLGRSENEYVSPYWIAIVYIGLGDKDQAFRWMEKAYQEKDGTIAYLNVIPIFDNLRSDERFISLIHKLKLKK